MVGGGRRCGISAPADAGARAAVYEPVTVSSHGARRTAGAAREGAPPWPDAKEMRLRDLAAPGPGPAGWARAATQPRPFLPARSSFRVAGPKEALRGAVGEAAPSPRASESPPRYCSREVAERAARMRSLRLRHGLGPSVGGPEHDEDCSWVCGGLSCVYLEKQMLFLLGPAVLH